MPDVTYRYTTDPEEVPDGAASAFVAEGTYTNYMYNVKHIVRGDFKAGTTYRFTVRAKYFKLVESWSWSNYPMSSMYIDFSGKYGATNANSSMAKLLGAPPISTSTPTDAFIAQGLVYDLTVTEDCDQLIFASWLRDRNEGKPAGEFVETPFKISFSIVYDEVKDYMVSSGLKQSYYGTGCTINYSEDTTVLPTGMDNGYIIHVGTSKNQYFDVINTLYGDFKAGTTYKVTIKAGFISGTGHWNTAYIKWGTTSGTPYTEIGSLHPYANSPHTYTVETTVAEDTDKLQFIFCIRYGGTISDYTYALSASVAEVVAE